MIRLFLDEDVPEGVALALRLRGYDVRTVQEAGRKGLTDAEQLSYARSEGRVLLTHNAADFARLHLTFVGTGKKHGGIILAKQLPIGVVVRAMLNLLSGSRAEDLRNRLVWLSDWIT